MNLGLMPFYVLQERASNDVPLAGGVLHFFESGTLTPKPVYGDASGATSLGTSVTLDASGRAVVFLGSGAYRIWLKDSMGAQVLPWVDGVVATSTGGQPGTNGVFAICMTYSDVRSLPADSAPDVVLVCGRATEGDGGEGVFQYVPGSTETDDAGIVLVQAGSGRVYRREFNGDLDPRWYGMRYGVLAGDQSAAFAAAMTASVRWQTGAAIRGTVALTANTSVPANARLVLDAAGSSSAFFVSTAGALTMTFAAGAQIQVGACTIWGDNVSPVIPAGVVLSDSVLRLSWFGGSTDDVKWAKANGCTTAAYTLLVDIPTNIVDHLTVPANFLVAWNDGCPITVSAWAGINIPGCAYQGFGQILRYISANYVGSVSLGNASPLLEWFGFLPGPSHTLDNKTAFKAAVSAGAFWLRAGTHYYVQSNGGALILSVSCAMNGAAGAVLESDQNLTTTNLTLNGITVTGTGALTPTNPATVTGSSVATVSKVGQATDSTFSAFAGAFYAGALRCAIVAPSPSSIGIMANSRFTDCAISQSGSTASPLFSLDASVTRVDVSGGSLKTLAYALLVYSESTGVDVYIDRVSNSANWTNPLSNGYAKVHLIGAVGKNQTAYSINGYTQDDLSGAYPPNKIATDATTNWRGVGSPISDGEWITLTSVATLSGDPYNLNTIRYIGDCSNTDATQYHLNNEAMFYLWRYGGQIKVKFIWPGSTPPLANLAVSFLCSEMSSNFGGGFIVATVGRVLFGRTAPFIVPKIPSVHAQLNLNAWGGQVDLAIAGSDAFVNVTDDWGDVSYHSETGNKVSCIPRIVIHNVAAPGIDFAELPIGFKFRIEIIPKLPNTHQYEAFWPDTYYALSGGTAISSIPDMSYNVMKWPNAFRSCDKNGLVTARTFQPPNPLANILPITSWLTADTFTHGYS